MPPAPQTKHAYLSELVKAKNRWFRSLTREEVALGFLGWHERGYLPHCDYPGLIQFVTFRLADSMPASRRGEWEHLLKTENTRERRRRLEDYLDRGIGRCCLQNAEIARIVESSLLHFHENHYELLAWCVMPNHVHVLVDVRVNPLAKILQSWKSFIGGRANAILGRTGRFWEPEYWDTFMRDEEQKLKAIQYIERNPVRAGLSPAAEAWPFSSARYRDPQTGRLNPGAQSSGSA